MAPEPDAGSQAEGGYWKVVDDLFSGEERWRVLQESPRNRVKRRPVSAAGRSVDRTVSKVGWAMSPPAAVGVLAPKGDGPLRLNVSVAPDGRPPEVPRVTVRFSVSIEGEQVWSSERTLGSRIGRRGHLWEPVLDENEEPFLVEPGDEVRFQVELVDAPTGRPLPEDFEVPTLAFGEPRFERWVEVEGDPVAAGKPNLLLYVVDTLRRDRLSPYGHPGEQTPALQRLADRGLLFENAYSTASWTWPSTASLLTGLLPAEHGLEGAKTAYLDGRLETIAERARASGYRTAGFVGNPLIDLRGNFQQGFETFAPSDGQFRKSEHLLPPALEWLRTTGSSPFFLYVHTVDTHYPYKAYEPFALEPDPKLDASQPDKLRDWLDPLRKRKIENSKRDEDLPLDDIVSPQALERLEARYLACVRTADHWFGQTVEQLDQQGVLENTVIAFTTDHGEEFLEHDLINHGASVNDSLVHVPLILAGPGVPKGQRIEQVVSNRHVADTLAQLAGGKLQHAIRPINLLQDLSGAPRTTFASTEVGTWDGSAANLFGVFDGRFALHTVRDVRIQEHFARLYDLRSDDGEFRDLAEERPQDVKRLIDELRGHLLTSSEMSWGLSRKDAAETIDFLEQLGYTAPGEQSSTDESAEKTSDS